MSLHYVFVILGTLEMVKLAEVNDLCWKELFNWHVLEYRKGRNFSLGSLGSRWRHHKNPDTINNWMSVRNRVYKHFCCNVFTLSIFLERWRKWFASSSSYILLKAISMRHRRGLGFILFYHLKWTLTTQQKYGNEINEVLKFWAQWPVSLHNIHWLLSMDDRKIKDCFSGQHFGVMCEYLR